MGSTTSIALTYAYAQIFPDRGIEVLPFTSPFDTFIILHVSFLLRVIIGFGGDDSTT